MKIFKSVLVLVSVLLVNTSAMAVSADTQSKSEHNKGQTSLDTKVVAAKLLSKLGLQAESIKASSMEGMAEAVTKQGLFYVSYDGNYILQGKLYKLKKSNLRN